MKKVFYITLLILGTSHSIASAFTFPLFRKNDPEEVGETKGLRWAYLRGLEYRLRAGFNLGGTSPVPLPAEIRQINSYDPTLQIAVEGDIIKWFDDNWGLLGGIRLENKGMKTDARVKNYGMKMIAEDGGKMEGYWTGNVTTEVQNSYLTVPVDVLYRLTDRWEFKAGGFVSYQTKGHFSGHVYEGYLREGTPTGTKVVFEGNSIATYDFSKDLRSFQCGAEIGAQWRAYKHLSLYADLTWGFVPIFKSDFKTITFNMYPIYANIGFAYKF